MDMKVKGFKLLPQEKRACFFCGTKARLQAHDFFPVTDLECSPVRTISAHGF